MKLAFFLMVSIALSAAILSAQNRAMPSSATAPSQGRNVNSSNSGKQQIISGCLNQAGHSYTLTDSRTGSIYSLTGNTGQLRSHVGHEMQMTGYVNHPVSQNANGAPAGNASGSYSFQVSTARHIADQCGPGGATANGPSL